MLIDFSSAPPPTESYWQIGCNDGRAGRARRRFKSYEIDEEQGYENGYAYGKMAQRKEQERKDNEL